MPENAPEGNAFLVGSTEDSDLSSSSSILTLATWREARGESTETPRGIFRTAVNRAANPDGGVPMR